MLQPMTLSATSAFDPSVSFFRAAVTGRTTSSGRIVDVRRISSRMLSNSAGSLVTSWSGAVAVIRSHILPFALRDKLLQHEAVDGFRWRNHEISRVEGFSDA